MMMMMTKIMKTVEKNRRMKLWKIRMETAAATTTTLTCQPQSKRQKEARTKRIQRRIELIAKFGINMHFLRMMRPISSVHLVWIFPASWQKFK